MRKEEFWQYVERNAGTLDVLDYQEAATPERAALALRNRATGRAYRIPVATLSDLEERELDELLSGARGPVAVVTMTRIVGYYSLTANWNRSKLAELADRHRGRYTLDEPAAQPMQVVYARAAG